MADRSDVLRKVRAMLDRADHPNTPPEEADTARRMADEMMTKFTIAEFELEFAKPAGTREKPVARDIIYGGENLPWDVSQNFYLLLNSLADLSGVKVGFLGWNKATVVGYERDIDYLELLFTAVRMHMSANLAPTPDPTMSWEINLVRFKRAGMKWDKIHKLLRDIPGYPFSDKQFVNQGGRWGVRLTKTYTDWCKEHGEQRVYDHPDVWRRSFTEGYVSEVRARVRRMKRDREGYTAGKELVLHNRDQDLMDALYELFPEKRPHPLNCDCDVCHHCNVSTCSRPNCKSRRAPIRRTAGVKEVKWSADAFDAGKSSGATVDLSSGGVSQGKRGEIG